MNLYEFAKNELDLLEKDCKTSTETNMQKAINDNILEVVKLFASQQHSGTSARYVILALDRLLRFKPLLPLTGEDSEWEDVSKYTGGTPLYQNIRCPEIFKDKDGKAYWTEGKSVTEDNGESWHFESVPIEFPFAVPLESEQVYLDKEDNNEKS